MMNLKIRRIFAQLLPFIILGISLAITIGLFIMFSYVLLWGILIGCGIWLIVLLRNLFITKKQPLTNKPKTSKGKGRIIEHDDQE